MREDQQPVNPQQHVSNQTVPPWNPFHPPRQTRRQVERAEV